MRRGLHDDLARAQVSARAFLIATFAYSALWSGLFALAGGAHAVAGSQPAATIGALTASVVWGVYAIVVLHQIEVRRR